MSQSSARLPSPPTLAEWAQRLGSIPLERICLDPAPGTAREEHVLARHDRDNRLFELVEGTLVEKAIKSLRLRPRGGPRGRRSGAAL